MTLEQVTYNIFILQPMPMNILISVKQHQELLHFGVTLSYGRMVSIYGIVNMFGCCITTRIVLLQCQKNIYWLHHGLRHISNNNLLIFSQSTRIWMLTNDFVISWFWVPQINFIHHSPPKTGFAHNLNGHPHFLLPMHILTKSFFLGLYLPLFSQAINRNETLPLTPVFCLISLSRKQIQFHMPPIEPNVKLHHR